MARQAERTGATRAPEPGAPRSTVKLCVDALFDDVLAGRYLRGARVPAERDLSLQLGASRVSVRQALQRLSDWGVTGARRGSGTVVRDRREWTLPVLPAVVRFWLKRGDPQALYPWVDQMLELRRLLYGSIMRAAARRLSGRKLDAHRAALEHAWSTRDRPEIFAAQEIEFIRGLLADANMEAALWLLNTMTTVYLELAAPLMAMAPAPEDHRVTYLEYLDRVEAADPEQAAVTVERFMERYDTALLARLKP